MKEYQEIQRKTEKGGTVVAVVTTVSFHALLVLFGVNSGLTYLSPPPPEQSFVIDFSEEQEKQAVRQQKRGSAPQVEEPDRTKPIELVQKSEAQNKGHKANLAEESTVDDFGDVEKYEPPREKPIEKRALFHAANNNSDKDTLAPQTADKVTEKLKAGHAQGNTMTGKTVSTPNAHVKGRSVNGVIAKPVYKVQEEGTVVVTVWVDNYGNVKKAQAGAVGTTVNNAELWSAAREAALKTHFNMSTEAPPLQQGKITYQFKLTSH